MASIIPGYEYDIFISYRQKDNRGEHWVSEFVEALKTELESTFKEEISVYFDINPHDGLLEIYDVDASLREKLKCLVFIPIISRTYCDPKSFAWEHEFKAFIEQASKDQFGLKVKLPNGNVAGRVLPIRIYDLDPADISLCESLLGGVLRGLEFIYKEPGVNRPLKPDDDEKINLNKTKYRNQINKAGNAIKEIITGIKDPEVRAQPERPGIPVTDERKQINIGKKFAVPAVILTLLIIAGLLFLPFIGNRTSGGSSGTGKSIAVLPFDNISNDPDQEYLSVAMVDEILDKLCKIGNLKVIARTSSERFKNTKLSMKEIARELGVGTIMMGSVGRIGNNIRVTAQLIDPVTEAQIWSEIYNSDLSDIFKIQSNVAKSVARKFKTVITNESKRRIDKKPTTNMAAYEAYWRGMLHHRKLNREDLEIALKYFELAREKDPGFALAYSGIGRVWRGLQQMSAVKVSEGAPKEEAAVLRALELDSTSSEVHHLLGGIWTWSEWDWKGGEASYRKAIELNPQNADAHSAYSHLLSVLGRSEEAMKHISVALDLDPMNSKVHAFYGVVLLLNRRYDDALKAFQKTKDIDPSQGLLINMIPVLYFSGREEQAKEMMKSFWKDPESVAAIDNGYKEAGFRGAEKKIADLLASRSRSVYIASMVIAYQYCLAGDADKGMFWLEKAYEEHSPNLPYLLSPVFDIVRDRPQFKDIAFKMQLPYK
jgi:TolB-like protein